MLIFVLSLIPVQSIIMQIVQGIINKVVSPKQIPKLDFLNGIPEEYSSMVIIPTIIKSKEKIEELIKKLEVYYLANKSENIYFTLLGDPSSSSKEKEDFDDVINVNLIGTFNVTKNVVPYMMKQRNGSIINISSVVGINGNAGQSNYSASKAGIIGFTKSLAKELGSRNILVNAIAPGFIETQMTDVLKDEVKEEIVKKIPLRRTGKPQDVANVVKFLSSEDSSYIAGQIIQVDGGMI